MSRSIFQFFDRSGRRRTLSLSTYEAEERERIKKHVRNLVARDAGEDLEPKTRRWLRELSDPKLKAKLAELGLVRQARTADANRRRLRRRIPRSLREARRRRRSETADP
jgi:hypothetical protein